MTDDDKKAERKSPGQTDPERLDVANEPVDLDENEMVDTGVLHEIKPTPEASRDEEK